MWSTQWRTMKCINWPAQTEIVGQFSMFRLWRRKSNKLTSLVAQTATKNSISPRMDTGAFATTSPSSSKPVKASRGVNYVQSFHQWHPRQRKRRRSRRTQYFTAVRKPAARQRHQQESWWDFGQEMMFVCRRSFLLSVASFLTIPTIGLAEDAKPKFKYIPSKLGIDYRALAPSPLAEILSHGEVEWMQNASKKYGEDTADFWKLSISKKVSTGAISQSVIDKLRAYTPNMLNKFAVGLDPQDRKYGGLWSVGNLFIAERLAGKAWYFCKIRSDILQLNISLAFQHAQLWHSQHSWGKQIVSTF